MTLHVDCVACKIGDAVYCLPRPNRHCDLIVDLVLDKHIPPPIKGKWQGFLDSNGRFITREEARKIAEDANQLLPRAYNSTQLYSEDIF